MTPLTIWCRDVLYKRAERNCALTSLKGRLLTRLPSSGEALVAAISIGLLLSWYHLRFGTDDVEESTHLSYSAGAPFRFAKDQGGSVRHGVHDLLGIPVYDTLQGTGDRLPYQGSWAQSVTWPFRLFVSWEHLAMLMSFVFGVSGLWLTLSAFGSWFGKASRLRMVLLGLLLTSPFGLYLRHNEWSHSYIQTIGVIGVAAFLMHHDFFVAENEQFVLAPRTVLLAVFVSINGLLTGHPGFWPVALFTWVTLVLMFGTQRSYRKRLFLFIREQTLSFALCIAASAVTLASVTIDLLSELPDESSGRPLSRTQGLFSEHVFRGVYGLSDGSSLSEPARRVVSSLLATIFLPGFMAFDSFLPSFLRASSFKEIVRVEFTGSMILLVLIAGSRHLNSALRRFVLSLTLVQFMIWLVIVLSTRDMLPTQLAPSGAWFFGPVLLAINVFLSFLLLDRTPRSRRIIRISAVTNLVLVGFWCLVQFGIMSFGLRTEIPRSFPPWFRGPALLAGTDTFRSELYGSERIVLVPLGHWSNFLTFTALDIPVVMPADPKIRDASQLMPNEAFNNSLMWRYLPNQVQPKVSDRVFDFLQIENVVEGTTEDGALFDRFIRRSENAVIQSLHSTYKVTKRKSFSAFVMSRKDSAHLETCPVLTFSESCAVVFESRQVSSAAEVRLRICDTDCLWRYRTPRVDSADVLIVPVSFDRALTVSGSDGRKLSTFSAGGFLGVSSDGDIPAGDLEIRISPDLRILLRVLSSYMNVVTTFFLVIAAANVLLVTLRARLRVN